MNKIITCLFVLALAFQTPCYANDYEKEVEIPACKLTYKNLNKIFESLRSNLNSFTSSEDKDNIRESIKISGRDITVRKSDAFLLLAKDRLPDIASHIFYQYSSPSSQVSEISIYMTDRIRTVSVSGKSPDNVDAVVALLYEKFNKEKIVMGGAKFRLWGGFLLFIFAMLLWNAPLWLKGLNRVHKTSFIVSGVALYLCTLFLPFDDWFPGFAVYTDSASFFSRHATEISFVSVLLSVVFFVASIFFSWLFSNKNNGNSN
jgi:hypothetical protein